MGASVIASVQIVDHEIITKSSKMPRPHVIAKLGSDCNTDHAARCRKRFPKHKLHDRVKPVCASHQTIRYCHRYA